jgi:peptidoglycan/xylan/chitin deacetylase (PgdA/CDA1 family)
MPSDAATRAAVPRVPILAYHSLDEGPSPISISPARFRDHMQSLHDGGWRTLSLTELLEGHAAGGWPARSVVLTFDDGMANLARHAWPVLGRLGFTAVLFAVSGRLGGSSDWPGWPPSVPALPLLDARALRDAAAAGFDIGAHSVSHPRLSRLAPPQIEREIVDSQARLQDVVGRAVRCFAYPFGDAPPAAVDVVARRFEAGFGIGLAHATPRSPVTTLERIDAYYLRGRSRLAGLDSLSMRAWLSARSVLRRAGRRASYGT